MATRNAVAIFGAKRSPVGSFLGQFAKHSAIDLCATAISAALKQSEIPPANVDEVLIGCVLPAGLGQAPARQASLAANLPDAVPATTLNKVCGSGMKAVMLAYDQICAGEAAVVVAGGMESMSNAPYLLARARSGYRLGHGEILDHMFLDGLQSPFDGRLMGSFAEACAKHYQFTRAEQDAFATQSVQRAQAAQKLRRFEAEIAAVRSKHSGSDSWISEDETPQNCDISKIPKLKPAFEEDGTVTPANSSSISDGAAALIVASEASIAGQPLARIAGHTTFASAPEWFTTAPVGAIAKLLKKIGWTIEDVDLFEINEAFAVVTMAAMRDLAMPADKVNVNGGACALGHPIGATGARILVTLIYALRARGLRRGVASLCLGGGEATAVAIEIA